MIRGVDWMSNLTDAHNLIEKGIGLLENYKDVEEISDIVKDMKILKRKLAEIIW